ncbi:glycoside hydrolase family 79 protein [Macrolepiota fuliginosa MF-IS2]|uniref:Glycoside hydrolase family 79 protein n=1 Tax=Macrolepiota fuliginosa MF-IS2 TaxID=1400762 RepID=A0A9P6C5T8_9AGAR|nr:glycoside hydrolase family 79 protein [Macrolepiota fuliginosa MF-IS2]
MRLISSSLSSSLVLSLLLSSTKEVNAGITVYGQRPLAQTLSAAGPATTTLAAYNDTELIPPPLPTALNRQPKVELQRDAVNVQGLSMPHRTASFFGFSIEMSVINQVLGKNSTFIQVPFLNLMANLQERAGHVLIRLGGNTQEYAVLVDQLDNGKAIAKEKPNNTQTTMTPAVLYTLDMFYTAANISQLVNVNWFLGIPFNDTNWRLAIAEYGEAILGDKLIGMQAGNEPDLYDRHGHRPAPYGPYDYYREFGELLQTMQANDKIPRKNILIGPSLSGEWAPEMIWDTGYITTYQDFLYALAVEHYPSNNCAAQFGVGTFQDPQENFPRYLTHNAGVDLVRPYLNSTAVAQQANKPFIMFETNTASCGGFPGISDSFGAALWAMDYGFQMAYSNFSNALLHIGGQNVYYNPFTSPPTNQSTFNQWTVGAIYYSVLVLAEAFGKSNTSQIVDLTGAIGSEFTPAYALYENGALSKVALINYNDDLLGTRGPSDLSVTLSVPGAGVPSSVKVKYLQAKSVSSKYNITWAGQTFGNKFEVDGRLRGNLNVVDIPCDTANNACTIPVPAPGFALVFFNSGDEFASLGQASSTFATSAHTKTINTITIDPSLLATSNGHSAKDRKTFGSTSKGGQKANAGGRVRGEMMGAIVLGGFVAGVLAVVGFR